MQRKAEANVAWALRRPSPNLCIFMRSSLWLALTACMALRPLGCDALLANLLLIVRATFR